MPPGKNANQKGGKRGAMSAAHKAALSQGRVEGAAVRNYLDALETQHDHHGGPSRAALQHKLDKVNAEIEVAEPFKRLSLHQRRLEIEADLEALGDEADFERILEKFIANAKHYGERKGITYAAWIAAGVPEDVLRKARISDK